MTKLIIGLMAALVILLIVIIYLVKKAIKLTIESNRLKRIVENYQVGADRVEENIKNANELKKKFNTGNPDNNVNNATDIMSDIANKWPKS